MAPQTLAQLPVRPASHYMGECPKFSKPKEVACFSRDSDRKIHFDQRALRQYVAPQLPARLDVGFESYVPKQKGAEPAPLADVFSALSAQQQSTDGCIVTYRNNLNKLMLTPYSRRDDWEIGVSRQPGGGLTLQVRETARKMADEARRSEREQRMAYWGYKFEALATTPRENGRANGETRKRTTDEPSEDRFRVPSPCDPDSYRHLYPPNQFELLQSLHGEEAERQRAINPTGTTSHAPAAEVVDANEEFCAIMRLKLAGLVLIMAAECDCQENARGGERQYVELKTSKLLREQRDRASFEKHKLLKFWLQSFLAGVPKIVVGFRDDAGVVHQLQAIETLAIPRMVRAQGHWDPSVCLNFGREVLTWLLQQVATRGEDERLVLRYEPSQELLLLMTEG